MVAVPVVRGVVVMTDHKLKLGGFSAEERASNTSNASSSWVSDMMRSPRQRL